MTALFLQTLLEKFVPNSTHTDAHEMIFKHMAEIVRLGNKDGKAKTFWLHG